MSCMGKIFKCTKNIFYNNQKNSLESKTRLRLMKRLSCKGCANCGWIMEPLAEDAEHYVPCMDFLEDQKLYRLEIKPAYPDDVEYSFSEVKPDQKPPEFNVQGAYWDWGEF